MTIAMRTKCIRCGTLEETDESGLCVTCYDAAIERPDPKVAEAQRRYREEHKAEVAEAQRRYREERRTAPR